MPHNAMEFELPHCLGPSALWNALDADPLTSVLVVTMGGKILSANAQAARFLVAPNADATALTNRSMLDALPRPAGQHYGQLFQDAKASGRAVLLREIWQGRQVVTRIQHIAIESCDGPDYADGVLLMVGRRVEGSPDEALGSAAPKIEAPYVHLGPLTILSDREIEVLSLLATGLTAKQIAKRLDRSFKTVENHRYVIGRKLGATDRHALAAIAIRAGLTADDAKRTRL